MPSLFPELFTYSLLAVTVLRVFVSLYFVLFATRHLLIPLEQTSEHSSAPPIIIVRALGIIEAGIGLLLFVGFATQPAALAGGVVVLLLLRYARGARKIAPHGNSLYALLFVVCVSLIFLGPGLLAFDLPL